MRVNIAMVDEDGELIQVEGIGKTFEECMKNAEKDYKEQVGEPEEN